MEKTTLVWELKYVATASALKLSCSTWDIKRSVYITRVLFLLLCERALVSEKIGWENALSAR